MIEKVFISDIINEYFFNKIYNYKVLFGNLLNLYVFNNSIFWF